MTTEQAIEDETTEVRIDELSAALREIKEALVKLASDVRKLQLVPSDLDKDTMAVALMLTMTKPTKRKIARAMGYADHTGLRNLPKFNAAWERFQIMQTVTGGNGRSVVGFDGKAASA